MNVEPGVSAPTGVAGAAVLALLDATGRAGGTGRVIAAFSRAIYVDVEAQGGSAVVALVDREVEPGPLHLVLEGIPSVPVGTQVRAGADRVVVGQHAVVGPFSPWSPPRVDVRRMDAQLLRAVVADHRPALGIGAMAAEPSPEELAAALEGDGILAVSQRLAGRGPGLTPSGDDVLAGLLLVARLAHPEAQDRLERLAGATPTHEIARAFLRWASRGHSIAAAHDLLRGAAASDEPLTSRAFTRLTCVGASSGRDLAYGLLVGSMAVDSAPWGS